MVQRKRRKKRAFSTLPQFVCSDTGLMTIKAVLQALEEGMAVKFIDVTINFRLFYFKKLIVSN